MSQPQEQKRLKWMYVYSPKYEIFHVILQSLLRNNTFFDVHPISVPQEVYSNLYRPGASHFMSGNTVRFEILLNIMKKLPEGEQFIFSDVDLFIKDMNGLINTINTFRDKDLVFMHDTEYNDHMNIGFGLIKNIDENRVLFKTTLDTIKSTGGAEQDIINDLIKELPQNNMKLGIFPIPAFSQSNFKDVHKSYILQMLCSSKNPEANMFEKLLTVAYMSDIRPLKPKIQPIVWNSIITWMRERSPSHPIATEHFIIETVMGQLNGERV